MIFTVNLYIMSGFQIWSHYSLCTHYSTVPYRCLVQSTTHFWLLSHDVQSLYLKDNSFLKLSLWQTSAIKEVLCLGPFHLLVHYLLAEMM